MKKEKIFVNIASYKDPELRFTVDTLIQRATKPENLRIVICQQHEVDKLQQFEYPFVETINHNYIDSQGVCWARRQVQDRYDDEEYFLQIDSHIAMTENWDDHLKEQMAIVRRRTSNKVIFGAYPSHYRNDNGVRTFLDRVAARTQLRTDNKFRHLSASGGPQDFNEPIPSPYINAGLMFGDGAFNRDCLYDPEIYFEGEELLNTLKAFTRGYDLFNPSVHMAWHLYKLWTEDPKTWIVHHKEEDDKHRPIRHWVRAQRAHEKLIKIFSGEMPEVLGTVRTIAEYEKYINHPILKPNVRGQ
jgi:hypothetical protein